MASKVGDITFYADDPQALSRFWAEVPGYPSVELEGEFEQRLLASGLTEADLAKRGLAEDPEGVGPRLFFHHADGPKQGRNRIRLDIRSTPGRRPTDEEIEGEKDRVVALGATVVRLVDQQWGPAREHCDQMRDPEGNEFCLE